MVEYAGLSELTFDPRPDIRKSALEVLFDTLRFHGHMFSPGLWEKVFDSVLFPIFDYVRRATEPAARKQEASSEKQAELEMDAWLYETCTLALQLVVDLFVKFYPVVSPLLGRILSLLTGFIKRPHQSLAAIGVAAFVRLMSNAGNLLSDEKWLEVLTAFHEAAFETLPDLEDLVASAEEEQTSHKPVSSNDNPEHPEKTDALVLHLLLTAVKCRIAVQLLLVQVWTDSLGLSSVKVLWCVGCCCCFRKLIFQLYLQERCLLLERYMERLLKLVGISTGNDRNLQFTWITIVSGQHDAAAGHTACSGRSCT